MSDNKLKYYEVTSTTVVQANSKRDAAAIARGRRGIQGRTLGETSRVDRLSASVAKLTVSEMESLKA